MACSGSAQDETAAYLNQQVCTRVKRVALPPADLPSPTESQQLGGCNSGNLYYGLQVAPDAVRARKCAYLERENQLSRGATPFSGSGILMMIYANGKAVPTNYDLAIRFACEVGGTQDQLSARILHLQEMMSKQKGVGDIDLCDDAAGAEMEGWCARKGSEVAKARMRTKIDQLTSSWQEPEKSSLSDLTRAANNFIQSRTRNEIDLTGPGRGAFQVAEEEKLRQSFTTSLEKFEKSDLPKFSRLDWTKAEATLNALYGKIQGSRDLHFGTVTPARIVATERVWMAYREAWVKFGAVKYPAVTAEAWKTWLTQSRIEMLKEFVN
jgi:hypothetical protein